MVVFPKKMVSLLIASMLLLGSQAVMALDQEADPVSAVNPGEAPPISSGELESEIGFNVYAEQWIGDLDEMEAQRMIRVLTVYGVGRYYLDGGREKGLTYDLFKAFETFINERLGKRHVKLHVVFIPVARDELLSSLLEGRGDIAAAGISITPELEEMVDFTIPLTKEVSQILVTGPSAPQISSIDDLSGKSIYVRVSSNYRYSLDELNRKFSEQGKPEVVLEDASEYLEDVDLLEMVNAGLLEWAVVDDYKARIWTDVFDSLTLRDDIVFRSGLKLGAAVRKSSPNLLVELNEFMKTHRQGTLHGNMLINRYVKNFDWAGNALGTSDFKRFQDVAAIFEKYGEEYGIDYLMVAAQGYQESGLDQSARSGAGAVGIMQLLPSTAADKNVGIPDISDAESNIEAGVKYLDFIRNRYFNDPGIDRFNQTLFAFAAYNAGPARVVKMRGKAEQQGYDPNIWFDNVEIIAAREIGRETVQYVANILKYYVGYRLSVEQQVKRGEEREKQNLN
ncbi:transglycosylase SLT domain-containing protein [Pseudomonadota bacterium]